MTKSLPAILIVAIALSAGCSPVKAWRSKDNRTVDLVRVVDAIKMQVDAAKSELDNEKTGIDLCEEVVSLQTTVTNSQNADFQVLIFKPVGKHITTRTTTVSVDLARVTNDTHKNPQLRALIEAKGVTVVKNDALKNLIIAAARQYKKIKDEPDPGLQRKDFTVDVAFAVEWDGTAGITFTLFGNGADINWELDNQVQHEVVLTFTLPGKCPN
jgi:hypothetical protein